MWVTVMGQRGEHRGRVHHEKGAHGAVMIAAMFLFLKGNDQHGYSELNCKLYNN